MKVITSVSRKRIKTFCNIIKQYKLMYQYGGINSAMRDNAILCIGLLIIDNAPVACCVIGKDKSMLYYYNIGVFTNREMRQRGYGKQVLLKTLARYQKINPKYIPVYSDPNFYERVLCIS